MNPQDSVVIEVFGEGKTDIGTNAPIEQPKEGVVPILLHRLCGEPERMRVKRKAMMFLQGKGLWQKVRFAKRQAYYNRSMGAVFVIDSKKELSAKEKDRIAVAVRDLDLIRRRCPLGFGPWAGEVEQRIRPLF